MYNERYLKEKHLLTNLEAVLAKEEIFGEKNPIRDVASKRG